MELFRTEDFYIFVQGQYSLWWDRLTGAFIPKAGWELTAAEDPICLGVLPGIIGKVSHSTVFDPRLLLIRESSIVGTIHGSHEVHKIKSVVFIPLGNENVDFNLQPCHKHRPHSSKPTLSSSGIFDIQKSGTLSKTWGTLKSAGNSIKNTTQQAAAIATGTPKRRDPKEKFEKRIVDEFYKIFNDTDSFYFCKTTDITNSLQRFCQLEKENKINNEALWKTVDDKFFWNKHMLKELIESNNPLFNPWILPIIQGYIQINECKVELNNDYQGVKTSPKMEIFKLSIISRRSRFRAGTRYKRRGVDENGECANYVETEQIVSYQHHEVSFVQVRGSVPVFWSQPGYKYRPPPRIDKGDAENHAAYVKHFTNEMEKYGPICIVNLVEQQGKEKIIWDAYSDHVFRFNHPKITYCTFDFHEYCKGMHFENVSILVSAIADIIRDMNYCWRDRQGHICSQIGVFRVNCIDCLDRTNVVQTALGKAVMEIQFTKLGLISPEGSMPANIKKTFQLLWANNGDTISKQYAGTNALKGDYTRTGERKFTGIMKDGMNSANRYYRQHFKDAIRQCCLNLMLDNKLDVSDVASSFSYLYIVGDIVNECFPITSSIYLPHIALTQEFELANAFYYMARYYLSRFKDSTRQGTIDLMLGNVVSEENFSESKIQDEEDGAATAEHVKLLIEDCKKMLLSTPEASVGAWGLINADPTTGDPSETEIDSILILTRDSYFVADYDDQVDRITKFQRVILQDIILVECGIADTTSLFRTSKPHYCIRLNYKVNNVEGYYHMFRSTNLRFFNNLAVPIRNEEEEIESLKAICEAFQVSVDIAGLPPIPYHHGQKLDRRKSKIVNSGSSNSSIYLDVMGLPNLTRNVSESQLLSIKSVGSKALSNVTQQFSKLNKLGSPFIPKNRKKRMFNLGKEEHSSSSDSDDYENSIFQPDMTVANSESQFSSGMNSADKSESIEKGVEATEAIKVDTFLPGVGIVMGSTSETNRPEVYIGNKPNLPNENLDVDNERLSSVMQMAGLPHIQINESGGKLVKKLSHSSGEVDKAVEEALDICTAPILTEGHPHVRSSSSQDLTLNISQSQSESALKNRLTTITSPVASAKDFVFTPLSKFARGVQHLGSNLDPRKLAVGGVRQVTEKEMEEHRKMQEKWRDCNTRLIAL